MSRPRTQKPPDWLASAFAAALARPRFAFLSALIVLLAGGWAALRVPLEWSPQIELPALTVDAGWPGALTQAVEREVTSQVERAIEEVEGIAKIESETREGRAHLRVEIAADRRPELVMVEISNRLAALEDALPPGVRPRLAEEVPRGLEDQQDFLTLQLVGPGSPLELRSLAEQEIAPRLRSLPGIASVQVEGGEESELLLTLSAGLLERHRKGSEQIRAAVRDATLGRSLGFLRGGAESHLLWWPAIDTTEELLDLPIAMGGLSWPLRELGDLRHGPAPRRSISRVDGQPVVTLTIERSAGSHLFAAAEEVKTRLETLRQTLPAGVRLLVATDRSEDVRRELRDLAESTGLGMIGVVLLLVIFLRGWQPMLLVLFAAAVSLAAGLAILPAAGLTLNVLTLAGLGLLVGMLVDSATVVVEALELQRPLSAGAGTEEWGAAVARTFGQVFVPLLGGTATTCAIFLPLLYLSGELWQLFSAFAWVAAITLFFSLIVAALGIPIWAVLLRRHAPAANRARRASFERLLLRPYAIAARRPGLVLLLILAAIGLPMPLLPETIEKPEEGFAGRWQEPLAKIYNATLGSEKGRLLRRDLDPLLGGVTGIFLEKVRWGRALKFDDKKELFVTLRLPPGSDIARTDELMHKFEALALAEGEVEKTVARIGERVASLVVRFREGARLAGRPLELREEMVAMALTLAGVEVKIAGLTPTGFTSGIGRSNGLPIQVLGPRWETCGEVAARLAADLRRDPRVAAIDLEATVRNEPTPLETLQLGWSGDSFARTGVSSRQLADRLRTRLLSHQADFYLPVDGEPRLPLRIVQDDAEALELPDLLASRLFPDRPFRLADLASLERKRQPLLIERQDQQYRRLIRVEFQGPATAGIDLIEAVMEEQVLPTGYSLRRPSEGLGGDELRRQLGFVLALATFLVFLVMAAVLESWRLAFYCLTALPVAWIGIALAFVLSGENFAEGAFLGVILIVGITVNNTILLNYRYRDLAELKAGQPPARLALLALRQRLRPMWAITATTIAGLVPIAFMAKSGDFWLGMALAVIGGLVASTLLAPAMWVAWLTRR